MEKIKFEDIERSFMYDNGDELYSHREIEKMIDSLQLKAEDYDYCKQLQSAVHQALQDAAYWYGRYKELPSRYSDLYNLTWNEDGSVEYKLKRADSTPCYQGYNHLKTINVLIASIRELHNKFYSDVVSYFAAKYIIDLPFDLVVNDSAGLFSNYPTVEICLVAISAYINGRSLMHATSDKLLQDLHKVVKPNHWCQRQIAINKNRITFPDAASYYGFELTYGVYYFDSPEKLNTICRSISFAVTNKYDADMKCIHDFDRRKVDTSRWYSTDIEGVEIKFYKNTRIDIKFANAKMAERYYERYQLEKLVA